MSMHSSYVPLGIGGREGSWLADRSLFSTHSWRYVLFTSWNSVLECDCATQTSWFVKPISILWPLFYSVFVCLQVSGVQCRAVGGVRMVLLKRMSSDSGVGDPAAGSLYSHHALRGGGWLWAGPAWLLSVWEDTNKINTLIALLLTGGSRARPFGEQQVRWFLRVFDIFLSSARCVFKLGTELSVNAGGLVSKWTHEHIWSSWGCCLVMDLAPFSV